MSIFAYIQQQEVDWHKALKANGHVPVMDEDSPDKLDTWVHQGGEYCNGPGCSACGETWCYHCKGTDAIKPCTKAALEGEFVNVGKQKALTYEDPEADNSPRRITNRLRRKVNRFTYRQQGGCGNVKRATGSWRVHSGRQFVK
ncbi:hypothetical protein DLP05_039 [Stenotrophomonas phage vB_SmaS_DLP_5]|uniref:Uncharacterized protein n=1 Tax=Stenotrophomonas phage vB_SmaS_DLP_5 TaxID=2044561 RepID=A0A2D2W2H3_9CAUD|nr:hypothetical protein FDJ07_gp038 [Stenotrophomonas phage vB_SmaS_DLP_5]ATS92344.1 hypothetical protein DLP05_039 [Stenotrophomonas phage vB_SmaS_DLP_5]